MKNPYLYFLITTILTTFVCCAQNTPKTAKQTTQKPISTMNEQDWKSKLTPEQYYILREKGTEKPFSGALLLNNEEGIYTCAGCGTELFTDDMKFDSHCGWPSFDKEIAGGKIKQTIDNSLSRERIEITCAKCGGHLGHIFNDGPTETGMRYCVNSLALEFVPETPKKEETLTVGAGCFWCVEAVFEQLQGVTKVESGYSGGTIKNPSYKEVCTGTTQHAEVVQITYNPSEISVEEILEVFFTVHDPTQLNRQGADVGTQYRSAIFYRNEAQKQSAEQVIRVLTEEKVYENPIVTEITAFDTFYKAEDYHQGYFELNKEQPYCKMVVQPKVEKFKKVFKEKLKK